MRLQARAAGTARCSDASSRGVANPLSGGQEACALGIMHAGIMHAMRRQLRKQQRGAAHPRTKALSTSSPESSSASVMMPAASAWGGATSAASMGPCRSLATQYWDHCRSVHLGPATCLLTSKVSTWAGGVEIGGG
jgi:hypothetical protein